MHGDTQIAAPNNQSIIVGTVFLDAVFGHIESVVIFIRHHFGNLDVFVQHHEFALYAGVVHSQILVRGVPREEKFNMFVDLHLIQKIVGLHLGVLSTL